MLLSASKQQILLLPGVIHMNFFQDFLQNKLFFTAAAGWLVAQILKTVIHTILLKEFHAERLVGSGGMPSSHSATVCALDRKSTRLNSSHA